MRDREATTRFGSWRKPAWDRCASAALGAAGAAADEAPLDGGLLVAVHEGSSRSGTSARPARGAGWPRSSPAARGSSLARQRASSGSRFGEGRRVRCEAQPGHDSARRYGCTRLGPAGRSRRGEGGDSRYHGRADRSGHGAHGWMASSWSGASSMRIERILDWPAMARSSSGTWRKGIGTAPAGREGRRSRVAVDTRSPARGRLPGLCAVKLGSSAAGGQCLGRGPSRRLPLAGRALVVETDS